MKTHCCILAGLFLVGHAIAATWTVDSNTARPADFRTLKAAHDATTVAAGDTLYLMPSTSGYGVLDLTKQLTIIGPGYLLNQNLPFSVAAPSARTGAITFYHGSSGSLVTGCEIDGSVGMRPNADGFPNNLTIKRNFINGSVNNGGAPSSNVQILQNHIVGSLAMDSAMSSSIVARGNFVGGSMTFSATGNSGIISHNVCNANMYAGGSCVFENNLVRSSITGFGTAMIRKCWGGGVGGSGTGSPTIVDCVSWTAELTFDGQFVGTGSLDARWQLSATAAVKGQGLGGVDPGHRTGPEPYVISGLPAVPVVKGILAPSSASAASGLPLTVELQVNP